MHQKGDFIMSFNQKKYSDVISKTVNDFFMLPVSEESRIMGIRKLAEFICRRLLDMNDTQTFTLGALNHMDKPLKESCLNNAKLVDFFKQNANTIRTFGNDAIHTQHTEGFNSKEIKRIDKALINLYAVLFIKYFLQHPLSIYNKNSLIAVFMFSLLPPVIRFKTLNFLYKNDNSNIQIINKLCLAYIKTFGKEEAYSWLDQNKKSINAIKYPSEKEQYKYYELCPITYKNGEPKFIVSIKFYDFNNMYDLLKNKIDDRNTSINESGKLYNNLSEAKKYFENAKKSFKLEPKEILELLYLLEFCYLGR